MKGTILIALALLPMAGAALAQDSMDLGWVACRSSANTSSLILNDVTVAQFDCNQNISQRNLVVSVKIGTYTTWDSAAIQLDYITQAAAQGQLPDWWDVADQIADPGNCRAGGLVRATVGTHSACANPYGIAQQTGSETFFAGTLGPGTYRLLGTQVAVGGAPFIAPELGGHAAMVLTINSLGTVDEVDGTVVCSGCNVPACLVLNWVDVMTDGVTRHIETVTPNYGRQWVFWMGGTTFCGHGDPTPVENATWGRIKALYR